MLTKSLAKVTKIKANSKAEALNVFAEAIAETNYSQTKPAAEALVFNGNLELTQ